MRFGPFVGRRRMTLSSVLRDTLSRMRMISGVGPRDSGAKTAAPALADTSRHQSEVVAYQLAVTYRFEGAGTSGVPHGAMGTGSCRLSLMIGGVGHLLLKPVRLYSSVEGRVGVEPEKSGQPPRQEWDAVKAVALGALQPA